MVLSVPHICMFFGNLIMCKLAKKDQKKELMIMNESKVDQKLNTMATQFEYHIVCELMFNNALCSN